LHRNTRTPPCTHPSIFKAYDIRGIVPSTLNEEVARALGRAFGMAALAEGRRPWRWAATVVCPVPLSGALMQGWWMSAARDRHRPVHHAHAVLCRGTLCESGIQVTGSHNPKDYNGFKMVLAAAPSTARRSRPCAAPWKPNLAAAAGGSIRHVDVLADYSARIVGDAKLARP
jgi:phosphomannomutase